jgi:hypothetical protein
MKILLIFLVITMGCSYDSDKRITQCNTSLNNCLDKGKSFVGPGQSTDQIWSDCQRTYEACMGLAKTP